MKSSATVAALTMLLSAAAWSEDVATRPALNSNRWMENWSALSDPAMRSEPLDRLKYLPLAADDSAWLTLGLTLRERFEYNDAANFGIGNSHSDSWLLQRAQFHADARFGPHWQAFVQVEDDRAYGKQNLGGADKDPLDLRLAFVAYSTPLPDGSTLKARVGRQDFAFDLQRFVSSRDGPNVRQSFDAAWLDWETSDWRVLGFISQPVQYAADAPFDDTSNRHFRFDTLRVERHVLGGNELSAYYSRYARDNARYGDAKGDETRHVFDARFAGKQAAIDWDLEAMGQTGWVGNTRIRAWAVGARGGYSWSAVPLKPRLGLQLDAASGDHHASDGTVGTFNPLFPNGNYFALAGYTGYANLYQLKPSLTLSVAAATTLQLALAGLWRQSTADAIYTQPNVAVAGSAGAGSSWTGVYDQLRLDTRFNPNLSGAVELVHYQIGGTLRALGGHDSNYASAELKFLW
ncbi:alginate export family protein [Silvimonas sp. JCM 19000]